MSNNMDLNQIISTFCENNQVNESLRNDLRDHNWENICTSYILDINLMRTFKDYLIWGEISKNQILSEDIIREFKDYVYWPYICLYQILTREFINEFRDETFFSIIAIYQINQG